MLPRIPFRSWIEEGEGLFPDQRKVVVEKGCKLLNRTISITICEAIVKYDRHRIEAGVRSKYHSELFFNKTLEIEVINLRAARIDARDILQDLQDVANGIQVFHAADNLKAAKAQKRARREAAMAQRIRKAEAIILTHGWDALEDIWKHRAQKLLDAERIDELIQQRQIPRDAPPLFYNDAFNREGRKMRAVFERAISDGTRTYRLWCAAGKPDSEYPRAENDKYILHAEISGYLLPLGMTDFHLVNHCGFETAVKMLYGGNEERKRHFDSLRGAGGDSAVLAALEEEKKAVAQYGNDPARQTELIQLLLNERVSAYLKAKEKAYCEEQNWVAEQAVSVAIQVIRDGGVLENTTVDFYRSRYDSSAYSIINYLMRLYQVDVLLRTQGWISKRLHSATIRDGECKGLQYYRSKNGRCSQKFYQCMDDLIRTVTAQASKQTKAGNV